MEQTKSLEKYVKQKNRSEAATESVSFLLTKAAEHMREAQKHIQAEDHESRFYATDKVTMILFGLSKSLDRSTPEQEKLADTLDNFYSTMQRMLFKVSVRNDLTMAKAVEACLMEMADTWQEVYRQWRILQEEEKNQEGDMVVIEHDNEDSDTHPNDTSPLNGVSAQVNGENGAEDGKVSIDIDTERPLEDKESTTFTSLQV